jgi:hypothetical protein
MKAFPSNYTKTEVTETGMDLRDYFAAQAMPFIAEGLKQIWFADQSFEAFSDTELEFIAERSYATANAMMKERGNK